MRMRTLSFLLSSIYALVAVTLLPIQQPGVAQAHEIWFYCPQKDIKVGDTVRVEYGIGETLFLAPDPNWLAWLSEELPVIKVFAVDPEGKRSEIALKKENAVLAGSFPATKPGTYVVNYVRENDYLTQTTKGWKRQRPEGLDGVVKSVHANFYQKVLINVEKSSPNYEKELGGFMEIIPLDDPAKAKVGEEIRFRVSYKGNNAPADVVVWGSYPGYSSRSHNWCYFGIPDENGVVYFKPLHSGPWQVGAEKYLDEEMFKERERTRTKPSFAAAVTFWVP